MVQHPSLAKVIDTEHALQNHQAFQVLGVRGVQD